MGLKQLVLAAFILVLIQLWGCNGCLEDERVGLLQIQASFNISLYPFHKTGNCCDWYRIECDAHTERVTHLYLGYARNWNFRGDWYLNASLFLPFKQLTYLNLMNNGITGCLHSEGFDRLAELNKLKYLDLYGNNFNNNILLSLSGLLFLKSLNISYNNLKGSINLGASLNNLEELSLTGNNITDVRAPLNLTTIYLDEMTANGMPLLLKSLAPFSSLKTLSLRNNNLSKCSFYHDSQSFKSLENLYIDGSIVDDNFFRSAHMLFSLKSLYFERGNGLDNLQDDVELLFTCRRIFKAKASGRKISFHPPNCKPKGKN